MMTVSRPNEGEVTEIQQELANLHLVENSVQDVIRLAAMAIIDAIDCATERLEVLARASDPTGVYGDGADRPGAGEFA